MKSLRLAPVPQLLPDFGMSPLLTASTPTLHHHAITVLLRLHRQHPPTLSHCSHIITPEFSTLKRTHDRRYMSNFHGLTSQSLSRYPPQSIVLFKGHFNQARMNQRSTKLSPATTLPLHRLTTTTTAPPTSSPSDPKNARTHHCFAAAVCDPATGQILFRSNWSF